MKDRVKSRVWSLVGANLVALMVVLVLAYAAGARSGGLSLLDFGALPKVAGLEFLAAALVVLVASMVLLLQLGTKVIKPTSELLAFSEKVVAGDYETRANVTPDDFGAIAENWNRAVELVAQAAAIKIGEELVRTDLAEVEKAVNQLSHGDLAARAPAAAHPVVTPVIESFNALAENYARRMERVRGSSTDISGAAALVMSAATEIASSAAQQEESTINAAAAIAQLSQTTQQVSSHASLTNEAAHRALQISETGSRAVRETADGMQRIRAAMQTTAEKIRSLAERSLEIYEIINVIHETNLLALNSLMEASRSSQGGQPMEVISAEMKKLGDHSRAATRDIVTLLKSIQAESNEAAAVMEQGNRVAAGGTQLMDQANRAFADIAMVLRQTAEFAEAISAASAQQVQGTESVAGAVQELGASLRQNASKSRQSAKVVEQMLRSSEQLAQAIAPPRPTPAPAPVPAATPTLVKPEKPEVVSAAVVGRA